MMPGRFEPRTEMETHKRRHFGHICETCGKSFDRASGLNRHVKNVHKRNRKEEAQTKVDEVKPEERLTRLVPRLVKTEAVEDIDRTQDLAEVAKGDEVIDWRNIPSPDPAPLLSDSHAVALPEKQALSLPPTYPTTLPARPSANVHDSHSVALEQRPYVPPYPGTLQPIDGNELECCFCGKQFTHPSTRRDHEKRHRQQKDFECTTCGKRFVRNSDLTRHMRVHTGEKPFKCHLCDYRAGERCRLQNHLKTHSGLQWLNCEQCEFASVHQSGLGSQRIVFFVCIHKRSDMFPKCTTRLIRISFKNEHT